MLLRTLAACFAVAVSALALAAPADAQTRLLMLEQAGCGWCAQWYAEVGTVYARTNEGKRAPLIRHDIFDPLPDHISLDRRAHYTPTFVLLTRKPEANTTTIRWRASGLVKKDVLTKSLISAGASPSGR